MGLHMTTAFLSQRERRFYHCFESRHGWFFIVPVGDAFALRLGCDFLGIYASAEGAAQAAASGRTRAAPDGINILRLNAPFDLERWEKLPLARVIERTANKNVSAPAVACIA